jgi:hypothetical protein
VAFAWSGALPALRARGSDERSLRWRRGQGERDERGQCRGKFHSKGNCMSFDELVVEGIFWGLLGAGV